MYRLWNGRKCSDVPLARGFSRLRLNQNSILPIRINDFGHEVDDADIRIMLDGNHTVADGMCRHLITLEREKRNLQQSITLCQQLQIQDIPITELDADAIVNIRFGSSAVMQGAAEVIAYGTAVKLK